MIAILNYAALTIGWLWLAGCGFVAAALLLAIIADCMHIALVRGR